MREFTVTTIDSLTLFVREWTVKTSPKAGIIIIHGLGEHSNRYSILADYLNQKGISVTGFDLRGHGLSQGQRGHSPNYDIILEDIKIILSEIGKRYPKIPIFLYGHSIGGQLVLFFALYHHPNIAGVISSAPWFASTIPLPKWKIQLGELMYRLMPTFSLDSGLEVEALSRDPEIVNSYLNDPLVHSKVSSRFGTDFLKHGKQLLNIAPCEFPYPLLITWGSHDRISNPRAITQFVNKLKGDITTKEWVGFFHEIHNEPEKQAVFNHINGWIKRHR